MNKLMFSVVGTTVAVLMFLCAGTALAHSPHDVIFGIALSPKYALDNTVFIITSNTLMKSTDEGHRWKKLANGLDYRSQLTSISISPAYDEDEIVLVTSENDGIYRSQNGGKSWEKVNQGLESRHIRSVMFSPSFRETRTAMALDEAGRLYESVDSARTWKLLDHDFSGKVTCLTYVLYEKNDRLLVGTDNGSILFSDESKGQWEKIELPEECRSITSMAVSPFFEEDGKIWAGTDGCGVFEINVRDKSCKALNQGLTDKNITSLLSAKNFVGELLLYASSWDEALFELDVKKQVWVKKDQGLTTDPQAKDPYFMMPNFKGIAVAEGVLFLGGYDGLFNSTDGGRTWEQLDTISLSGITGLSVYADKTGNNHQVALATYGAGAYLFDGSNQKWKIINKGLEWSRLNDMVFSPNYPVDGILFSGSENNFLRFDGKDEAWQRIPVSVGLKRKVVARIDYYLKKMGIGAGWRSKIFQPLPGDTRFPTAIGPSPNFAGDKTVFFGTRSSGLYKSTDAGNSNTPLWDADGKLITSLCLSPNYAADGTLFVGVNGEGIFKSTDKGGSWHKVDAGISFADQIYLDMSPDFDNDRMLVAGDSAGLYLSTDGGEKWEPIGNKDLGPSPNVECLAVSPAFKEDKMILVGLKGTGLWVTNDMGGRFRPFAEALIKGNYQAKFIKFSNNYSEDGIIYVAASYELFRSVDGGKSWQTLRFPTRYENFREEIKYTGEWRTVTDDRYSALSASSASRPGSRLRLRFAGPGFTWIGDRSPAHGQAKLYLDDALVQIVSEASEDEQKSVEIFSMKGLEDQSHELAIEVFCPSGGKECGAVSVDAIDVMPSDGL